LDDLPFTAVESKNFWEVTGFIRPGIHIPSADTLRRDLTENFKTAKETFRRVLQVNKSYCI
jgi:hypothetical protein